MIQLVKEQSPEVSHRRFDARAAAPFRLLFNDCGPPSMGYVQAVKPPGAQGSRSTYTNLLSVIEEMGKEIRPIQPMLAARVPWST
ncbi:hypothetical protein EI555_009032 [Monodon monoceros]|uniref:Uncharacterized protein n=1 Tax=Monodon monoceros TaxID=40151 RepID=A0A4U1F3R4_MONMO|nr:hypothetical protein EI555_009032 [Monodon monoceros]